LGIGHKDERISDVTQGTHRSRSKQEEIPSFEESSQKAVWSARLIGQYVH